MLRSSTTFFIFKRLKSGLSYAHCPGVEPLSCLTVGQLVDNAAQTWGSRDALVSIHQERRLTFKELRDETTRLAAGFVRLGLRPGERIAIFAPNCVEWELTQLAAAKTGLVLAKINPANEAPELRHCLEKVEATTLFYADTFRGRNFHDVVLQAAPDLKLSGDGKVSSQQLPFLRQLVTIGKEIPIGNLNFEDLIESDLTDSEVSIKEIEEAIQPDDGCSIQFTSGTTGKPKATLLSHHGIVNNSYFQGLRLGYHEKEHSICMPNPLFHCFGCVVGVLNSLHFGAKLVMPAAAHSPPHNLRAIQTESCNTIYGTPTMHVDLMKEARSHGLNGKDLGLELAVTGGALCPEHLFLEIVKDFKINQLCTLYGMTECSPVNFQTIRSDDLSIKSTLVGRIGDHWEAKVVDANGRMVPFGSPGELWVRGYGTMLQYFGEPGATGATLRPDGWLQTGDQFQMDENGYGQIVGRLKDMIIRGGENIFPREVEDTLHSHPDVLEAQVYGIPDDRLGEVVCASVRPRPDRPLTPEQLRKFCSGKMAKFKIPYHIEIVHEFPKTASGKIQKFRLQDMMIEKLKKEHQPTR